MFQPASGLKLVSARLGSPQARVMGYLSILEAKRFKILLYQAIRVLFHGLLDKNQGKTKPCQSPTKLYQGADKLYQAKMEL